MNTSANGWRLRPAGIAFTKGAESEEVRRRVFAKLEACNLAHCVRASVFGAGLTFSLRDNLLAEWMPQWDTLQLSRQLDLGTADETGDIEKEILLTMLAAPLAFAYPSFEEFAAAINIRRHIVAAARKTQLAFDTAAAERPEQYWRYEEERGFRILPGVPLIDALVKATQPGASGRKYSFSCYRATEYVILLGIARELESVNPALLARIQTQWEIEAIKSRRFHDAFLHEAGSMADPVPSRYYVPGDRVWFRNPDKVSSNIAGYEGSWVFYLGGGLFSNFWKPAQPYTLETKCVEIFHWRHGVVRNANGEDGIDEFIVDSAVHASLADLDAREDILRHMQRMRDPAGIHAHGGCLDASREFPKRVCPGTSDMLAGY
ncbi:MAG TPA: hypothetical protein VF472_16915 [Burkholderiaceae bacterium]